MTTAHPYLHNDNRPPLPSQSQQTTLTFTITTDHPYLHNQNRPPLPSQSQQTTFTFTITTNHPYHHNDNRPPLPPQSQQTILIFTITTDHPHIHNHKRHPYLHNHNKPPLPSQTKQTTQAILVLKNKFQYLPKCNNFIWIRLGRYWLRPGQTYTESGTFCSWYNVSNMIHCMTPV